MQNVDRHPKSKIYRVRVTFPGHLRSILGARSETKTLKTRSAVEARRAALPVLDALQRRIAEAERIYQADEPGEVAQLELTLPEGLRLIEQWRGAYLAKAMSVLTTGRGCAGDYLALSDRPEQDRRIIAANPTLMVELYYANKPISRDILNRTLDRLLRPAGYLLPERHPLRGALVGALRTAVDTIRAREESWKSGDWRFDTLPPEAPLAASAKTLAAPTAEPRAFGRAPPGQRTVRLRQLLNMHVQRTKPKSRTEQTLAVDQLCGFVGQTDPFVHEITFEQAERFYETLIWLPKSMTTAMRKRPLADVAADMRAGKLTTSRAASGTAAKKMQLLSALFAYAIDRDLIAGKNPFARVAGPKDGNAQTRRRPMSSDDLSAIFSAPLFGGCASYKGWRNSGSVLVANHRFWVPLLALVTGSRLEEIGQLLVSDVRKEDGIVFISITEDIEGDEQATPDAAKSVKTGTSIRRIPIHGIALEAGFEAYWNWLKGTGQRALFPELPAGGKRTKEMSRWFNRDFKPTVGLNDPARTFHSFRHGFKDRCRAAKLRRDLHDRLTGHSSGTAGERYGDGLALDDLQQGIDSLTFPGFPGVPPRRGEFVLTPGIGVEMREPAQECGRCLPAVESHAIHAPQS